ncbi:glycosyltransferase [Halalkalibacter sp. AB-rgal2]|uniref:CgeB family protein n=1 Tax=Halalkalibacter sp. AB-rgal2 TaxID=3242695 RepID=UPI00359D6111
MRVIHITSGVESLSNLDFNMSRAYENINKKSTHKINIVSKENESIQSLLAKIKNFKPDVIIVFRAPLPTAFLSALKKLQISIGRWVVDDPHRIDKHVLKSKPYDFVITQEKNCLSVYKKNDLKAIHGPLATNEKEYYPMKVNENYVSDICFIGTPYKNRLAIIDSLADLLQEKNTFIIGPKWEQLKNYTALKTSIINQTLPPNEVAKYYNGAKIVLNLNRPINDVGLNKQKINAITPNNRTFDIAACQSFQLTAYLEELEAYYKLKDEIICFKHKEELREHILYYLEHSEERQRIAQKAYNRTLFNHTYTIRLQHFLDQLQSFIK